MISDGGGTAGAGGTGGGGSDFGGAVFPFLGGLAGSLIGGGGRGRMAARAFAQLQVKLLAQQLGETLRQRREMIDQMNLGFRENPAAPFSFDQPTSPTPLKLVDALSKAQSLLHSAKKGAGHAAAKHAVGVAKHAITHFRATHPDSDLITVEPQLAHPGFMTRIFPA